MSALKWVSGQLCRLKVFLYNACLTPDSFHVSVDLHNKSAVPLSVFSQQQRSVYSPAPPPYLPPPATTFSSSTPDLASQAGLVPPGFTSGVIGVGGSSPDLVSRSELGKPHSKKWLHFSPIYLMEKCPLKGTVEHMDCSLLDLYSYLIQPSYFSL